MMSSGQACGDNFVQEHMISAMSDASIIRPGSISLPAQESVRAAPGYMVVTFTP